MHDVIDLHPRRHGKIFKLETMKDILAEFESSKEEWLVKKFWPAQGVGVIFGESRSFKSFLAIDLGLAVACGVDWAGRKTRQASVVYIAAEAPAGVRKRIAGRLHARDDLPSYTSIPFHMIPAAPNLGAGEDDLVSLIASIEATGVAPGLIEIDTLAQTIGGGDENGAGMIQYLANATALANRFRCCVLIVHHCGLTNDQRLRGHSSLHCGIDAQLICERNEGTFTSALKLQKLKDDEDEIRLEAQLARVVIRRDEDGDDVSTLIVDAIKDMTEKKADSAKPPKSVPPGQRLLMKVVVEALKEDGKDIHPDGNGAIVRAVSDKIVRDRLYAAIAEEAAPDEDKQKLASRQRQAFNRDVEAAIKAERLAAIKQNKTRYLRIV